MSKSQQREVLDGRAVVVAEGQMKRHWQLSLLDSLPSQKATRLHPTAHQTGGSSCRPSPAALSVPLRFLSQVVVPVVSALSLARATS